MRHRNRNKCGLEQCVYRNVYHIPTQNVVESALYACSVCTGVYTVLIKKEICTHFYWNIQLACQKRELTGITVVVSIEFRTLNFNKIRKMPIEKAIFVNVACTPSQS